MIRDFRFHLGFFFPLSIEGNNIFICDFAVYVRKNEKCRSVGGDSWPASAAEGWV